METKEKAMANEVKWETDWDAALERAKAVHKTVLMFFHSPG